MAIDVTEVAVKLDLNYQRLVLAMLLSNPNRSLRIVSTNLVADMNRYRIQLNTDLPSGDLIIYVEEKGE